MRAKSLCRMNLRSRRSDSQKEKESGSGTWLLGWSKKKCRFAPLFELSGGVKKYIYTNGCV